MKLEQEKKIVLKTPLDKNGAKDVQKLAEFETESGAMVLVKLKEVNKINEAYLLKNEIDALKYLNQQSLDQYASEYFQQAGINLPEVLQYFSGWLTESKLERTQALDTLSFNDRSGVPVFGHIQTPKGQQIDTLGWDQERLMTASLAKLSVILSWFQSIGFMHGEIKPKQIIVNPFDWSVTLVDYEMSQVYSAAQKRFVPLHQSPFSPENFLGLCYEYAAPEQLYDAIKDDFDGQLISLADKAVRQQRSLGAKYSTGDLRYEAANTATDVYCFGLVCLKLKKSHLLRFSNLSLEHFRACLELRPQDRPSSHELALNLVEYLP